MRYNLTTKDSPVSGVILSCATVISIAGAASLLTVTDPCGGYGIDASSGLAPFWLIDAHHSTVPLTTLVVVILNDIVLPSATEDALGVIVYVAGGIVVVGAAVVGGTSTNATDEDSATPAPYRFLSASVRYNLTTKDSPVSGVILSCATVIEKDAELEFTVTDPCGGYGIDASSGLAPFWLIDAHHNTVPLATLVVVILNDTVLPSDTDDTLGVTEYVGGTSTNATDEDSATPDPYKSLSAWDKYSLTTKDSPVSGVKLSSATVIEKEAALLLIVKDPCGGYGIDASSGLAPFWLIDAHHNTVPSATLVVETLNVTVPPSATDDTLGVTE